MYQIVGLIWGCRVDLKSDFRPAGYYVVNVDSLEIVKIAYATCANNIASICNARVSGTNIQVTNGMFKNLSVFDVNGICVQNPYLHIIGVIKSKSQVMGYRVFFPDGKIKTLKTSDVIMLLKKYKFFNAKLVTAGGKEYVSALRGSFNEIQLDEVSQKQPQRTDSNIDTLSKDFKFERTKDGTWRLTQYIGSQFELSIPYAINGVLVTEIASHTFFNYDFRRRVCIKSVTIPDSIKFIEAGAFVEFIGLKYIDFGKGAYSLEPDVFRKCTALTRVTLPNNITDVYQSFGYCSSLEGIDVSPTHPTLSSVNGVLFDKSKKELIQFPAGRGGSYRIPDGVVSIRDSAFEGCESLTDVFVPDSVVTYGDSIFEDCTNLSRIRLPASFVYAPGMFDGCKKLTEVELLGEDFDGDALEDLFKHCHLQVIKGLSGGAVEEYAYKQDIKFVPTN